MQGVKTPAAVFHEVPVSSADMEGVFEELQALSEGHRTLQGILLEKTFGIILNGRYINPYDLSEARLREGDELTLVPFMDAG